jgi:hypothetical protein
MAIEMVFRARALYPSNALPARGTRKWQGWLAEKAKEMDFAINLIQKIPAGWPRWATLAAIIAAYLFFPDIMKKLRGGQKEKATLERLMQFLQVKKMLLEIEVLQKEKNLAGYDFPGEARLLAELKETVIAAKNRTARFVT